MTNDDFDALRVCIRWYWVAAEIAMASGNVPAAVAAAQRSVELADAAPSMRHRVKSHLVRAAAGMVAGDPETPSTRSRGCTRGVSNSGLLPLQWAAAQLWAGVARRRRAANGAGRRAENVSAELARRGGRLRDR